MAYRPRSKNPISLRLRNTRHCSRVATGTSPGWGQLPARAGRERGRDEGGQGAAGPGLRVPGQRGGMQLLSDGIGGRSSLHCPGARRTWSRQSAACSEGAAPPGQREGGPAPRGAPPPMMRRPPTGLRPVTHSSPWLQHKATSPGGRFLPEEPLGRPLRRRRRKRRGRRGGRGSADARRGCALRSRPRARRGPAPGPPCPPCPPASCTDDAQSCQERGGRAGRSRARAPMGAAGRSCAARGDAAAVGRRGRQ